MQKLTLNPTSDDYQVKTQDSEFSLGATGGEGTRGGERGSTDSESNSQNRNQSQNHNQTNTTSSTPTQKPQNTPLDDDKPKTDNQAVLKTTNPNMKNSFKKFLPLLILVVLAGVGTGFGINHMQKASKPDTGVPADGKIQKIAGDEVKKGDVFGSADEKTFKDTATGYLEVGGLDGEGSHKLLRIGGASNTVYLTSTITDLDKFEGMEIQVWGETFKGQKVAWLMDVGRVKVIDTEGESPLEE